MRATTTRRAVLLGAGAAVLLSGCTGSGSGSGSGSGAGGTSGSGTGTTPSGGTSPTAAPSGTGSPSPSGSPSGTPSPSPTGTAGAVLRPGSSGPDVLALQERLTALGYWLGTPDGQYGILTTQAVTALQKLTGLSRDGIAGPKTNGALERGRRATARSSSGQVVEIDLERQVLLAASGGEVRFALNTSTGSGEWYTRPDGVRGHAVTPRGRYEVFRSVDAWDKSPLGELYRPRYFNGGIAVHGYPSVPSYPASHGCVRVSLAAMDMIWAGDVLPRRTTVWVY